MPETGRLPAWLVKLGPVGLIAGLVLHGITVAIWPAHRVLIDTEVYRAGARAVLNGHELYAGGLVAGFPFTYPPIAALLFIPLAFMPLWGARIFAGVGNVVLLGLAIYFALRHLRLAQDRRVLIAGTLFLTGALFWLQPVRTTMFLGQVNLLLMVLVLLDLLKPDSSRWKGVGVGLAAAIKLTPAIFVVYLLVTRRFRAAGVAVTTFAATVLIGWAVLPGDAKQFWLHTFFNSNRVGPASASSNQSINGLIARLTNTDTPSGLAWLLVAGVVGVAGVALAAWTSRRGEELLALCLVGMTATAVAPFSWDHHWVWFVPLSVLLLRYAVNGGVRGWWYLAAFYLLTFAWLVSFPSRASRRTPFTGIISIELPEPLHLITGNLYLLILFTTAAVAIHTLRPTKTPTLQS